MKRKTQREKRLPTMTNAELLSLNSFVSILQMSVMIRKCFMDYLYVILHFRGERKEKIDKYMYSNFEVL